MSERQSPHPESEPTLPQRFMQVFTKGNPRFEANPDLQQLDEFRRFRINYVDGLPSLYVENDYNSTTVHADVYTYDVIRGVITSEVIHMSSNECDDLIELEMLLIDHEAHFLGSVAVAEYDPPQADEQSLQEVLSKVELALSQ